MKKNNKLLPFGNDVYYLDVDKLMDFVNDIDGDEQYKNTTVTQTYASEPGDDNISLVSKEIMENRLNGNDTTVQLRYDLMKMLLDAVLAIGNTTYEHMTFAQKFVINTLMEGGIIYRLNNDENT